MPKDPVCGTDTAVSNQPKAAAKGGFGLVLEVEGRIHEILNLAHALDLIIEDIAGSGYKTPLTRPNLCALLGIKDALLSKAEESSDFFDDNFSALRAELGNASSVQQGNRLEWVSIDSPSA